ncbi:MAG: hypothetical protein ABMA13_14905, partial [Chthoniobacteraceae bacterium]
GSAMFAVLLLPNFRLQAALRWRAESPLVAISDEGVVVELTDDAAARGVRAGQPDAQALARCPELTLLPRALAAERVVQGALLEVAGSLSPSIEATADGCCTADLRGAKIAAWPRWCETVLARCTALELRAQVGVAPNPDLAFLAARRAAPSLVVQAPGVFLAQLAVSEINPPEQLHALLGDWGIHTLGQLTSLPRGELADRLGPDADRLWQRAAGQTGRLLRLVRPVEEFAEAFDFEHEIETTEPLLFILRRFLDQLTLRLTTAHRVAARLTLTLPLENSPSPSSSPSPSNRKERDEEGEGEGDEYVRVFTIPSPTADADALFRVLHTHLETLQLVAHPTGVRLLIEPALPERQQFQLFETALRDPNRFGETLARLAALVGAENVGVAEVADSHRPDDVRVVEPRFHDLREREVLPLGLPLRRFRPPLAAEVRVVRQVPAQVDSTRVLDALGPYRASGGWWEREQWSVEEWDVDLAGRGLFRLRREPTRWLIEGCYDAGIR